MAFLYEAYRQSTLKFSDWNIFIVKCPKEPDHIYFHYGKNDFVNLIQFFP